MWGSLQTEVLIMDEVQRLKNWKTQISMAARKVRSDYAVILSGTPLENKLEELYSVMEFADNYCLGPYW
jgi:SNF2 family DNA or RNA helicase